jgi:uncharacterized membrane protein
VSDAFFVIAVLSGCVVVAEVLARRPGLRLIGTALIAIIVAAVVANLGVIPTSGGEHPVYAFIFREGAWMAIFWLLLRVDLRRVLRAGAGAIGLFALGAAGTAAGALVATWLLGGAGAPAHDHALAGMFAATYIGGSANFMALASHYQVNDGVLLASANAVDSGMTTLWMAATLALPRLLGRRRAPDAASAAPLAPAEGVHDEGIADDTETVHPVHLGLLVMGAAAAVWASQALEAASPDLVGVRVPGILILTTLALVLAQVPAVSRLRGSRVLGMFGVYLFLATIGALCDARALVASGELGLALLAFVAVLFAVHAVLLFGVALLFRLDLDVAAVASQANIGGASTALALARSLGRPDLVLPAILIGSLGTALGTYAGLWVAELLA